MSDTPQTIPQTISIERVSNGFVVSVMPRYDPDYNGDPQRIVFLSLDGLFAWERAYYGMDALRDPLAAIGFVAGAPMDVTTLMHS